MNFRLQHATDLLWSCAACLAVVLL
jgi:hypothetical protein